MPANLLEGVVTESSHPVRKLLKMAFSRFGIFALESFADLRNSSDGKLSKPGYYYKNNKLLFLI